MVYAKNKNGHRICSYCRKEKLLTEENFVRDKSRKGGLSYDCKQCHRERKKGRDRRAERWSNLSPEGKAKVRSRQKKYWKTPKGRAIGLLNAYKKIDECDFSTDEMVIFLKQPCVHCGTTDAPRGLDRIDNSRGHTKDNVAPSCAPCNFARGNRFSFDEMKIIGKAIREVMLARKK